MKTLSDLLSNKQREFFFTKDARLNFLIGSVRSGKTYISLLKWALRVVATAQANAVFLICAKTLTTLKRNCLNILQELVGKNNFTYSLSKKEGILFGHIVYLEGANDETSEEKIRGMTLAGAYCDEVTLFPESFFIMLLSRLSVPGAKLYATCNPDSPRHWVKENYLDKADELDCNVWQFLLTDNTFLDEEYVRNISREYSGVFYNRFILGQWVRAEGIIYDDFANHSPDYIIGQPPKDIVLINIGVDFGGNGSATTFVCTGFTKGYQLVVPLISERHAEKLNPEQLNEKFADFAEMCYSMYGRPMTVYCDSAEQILIRGLQRVAIQRGLAVNIRNAFKKPILERIKLTLQLMAQGRFKVVRTAQTVTDALCEAVWDDKHEDERLDDGSTDIDTLDALEYSIEPQMLNLTKLYKAI